MTTVRVPKILILIVAYSAISIRESGSDPKSSLFQLNAIQEDDVEVKPNTENIDNIKNEILTPSTSEKFDFNGEKGIATLTSMGANKKQSSFNVSGEVTRLKPEQSLRVVSSTCSKFFKSGSSYPRDCQEVLQNGNKESGIYVILPNYAKEPFPVLCDMETNDGGWIHIQKRFDGSQDFFLDWKDYKYGFGNLYGEFWLGLERIYLLTNTYCTEPTELLVEIVDRDNVYAFAHYTSFEVGPEPEGYTLEGLSGFSGNAGDSLTYHLGAKFSTKDLDFTDLCTTKHLGAYWYKGCHESNLNGKYINIDLPKKYIHQGLHWKTFNGLEYSHAKSRMLIRPKN